MYLNILTLSRLFKQHKSYILVTHKQELQLELILSSEQFEKSLKAFHTLNDNCFDAMNLSFSNYYDFCVPFTEFSNIHFKNFDSVVFLILKNSNDSFYAALFLALLKKYFGDKVVFQAAHCFLYFLGTTKNDPATFKYVSKRIPSNVLELYLF